VPQPIVIFGGLLSFGVAYWPMREALQRHTGRPVWVVETLGHEWWAIAAPLGWAYLLGKLDRTVQRAARGSPTGRVTLIGHSAGGVLSRLYLSPAPFLGRVYRGLDYVDHLITLGSPHHNLGPLSRGGWMSRRVYKAYPGAYFAPQVRYTSVAGRYQRGDADGSPRERWLYACYRELCGDGAVWGDGLVPVPSALLEGSAQIVLDGASHFSIYGGQWYGDAQMIPRWWPVV